MDLNEILDLIKENNIKYLCFTCNHFYETNYFISFYDENKKIGYMENKNTLNQIYEFIVSLKDIEYLFNHFKINKQFFTCVYYKIN